MKYSETLPSTNLNDLILNYWAFEIPKTISEDKPFVHEMMPENTVSIVFINQPYFKGIRLLGPQVKRFQQQVYPGSTYLGIRFNPWVKMESIIGDKKSIINQTSALPNYLNNIFKEINIGNLINGFAEYHLLETGLLRLIENEKITIDPLVKYLCLQLKTEIKINKLIKNIPLSIRPIQKRFKSTTGITMSNFRSINMLRNTIKMIYLKKDSVTNAAFKNNYTDHSHFLNTFKKYMDSSAQKFLLNADKIELFIKM